MTLRYAEIDDDKLKQKFKALVLSGQVVGGAALKALKEQLEKGEESELDWVVANLRKLSLPWVLTARMPVLPRTMDPATSSSPHVTMHQSLWQRWKI
jgi:hypothetical protein